MPDRLDRRHLGQVEDDAALERHGLAIVAGAAAAHGERHAMPVAGRDRAHDLGLALRRDHGIGGHLVEPALEDRAVPVEVAAAPLDLLRLGLDREARQLAQHPLDSAHPALRSAAAARRRLHEDRCRRAQGKAAGGAGRESAQRRQRGGEAAAVTGRERQASPVSTTCSRRRATGISCSMISTSPSCGRIERRNCAARAIWLRLSRSIDWPCPCATCRSCPHPFSPAIIPGPVQCAQGDPSLTYRCVHLTLSAPAIIVFRERAPKRCRFGAIPQSHGRMPNRISLSKVSPPLQFGKSIE